MAKDTLRDRVWRAIIQLSEDPPTYRLENMYGGGEVEGFSKADIRVAIDGDVSDRTVHDVIQTASEYGLLEMVKEPAHASVKEHPETGRKVQMDIYRVTASVGVPELSRPDDAEKASPAADTDADTDADGEHDARYVVGCPECDYEITREQNSAVVKGVRRRNRVCPECDGRLELFKDDRPDPPVCPDCGEEALFDDPRPEHNGVAYVHEIELVDMLGKKVPERSSCMVSVE